MSPQGGMMDHHDRELLSDGEPVAAGDA